MLLSKHGDLFVINRDGTGETALVRKEEWSRFHAAWSHQGDRIVYSEFRHASPCVLPNSRYDVYLINANGTGQENVTADLPAACYFGGDFSPDDRKVVFFSWPPVATEAGGPVGGVEVSVLVKDLESGDVTPLVSWDIGENIPGQWGAYFMTPPIWCSADEIAFMRPHTTFRGRGSSINLVSANGTGLGGLEEAGGTFSFPNCGGIGSEEKMVYTEYEPLPSGGISERTAHLEIWPHPHRSRSGVVGFFFPNASLGVVNHRGTKVAYLDATPREEGWRGTIRVADLEDRGENPGLEVSCGANVLPLNTYPDHVVWSPDDQQIAFEAYDRFNPTPLQDSDRSIYIANVDGSGCWSLAVGKLLGWSSLRCRSSGISGSGPSLRDAATRTMFKKLKWLRGKPNPARIPR